MEESIEPVAPTSGVELIVRCDDVAGYRSANRAVAECARAGIATCASVMGNGPHLDDAALQLLDLPNLTLGMHVALNSEWISPQFRPVLPAKDVPSLVDEHDVLLPAPIHLHERGFDLGQLMNEVHAQFDRLVRAGIRPRYLDEHMGVGWLAGLADALARFAESHDMVMARRVESRFHVAGGATPDTRAASWAAALEFLPAGRHVLVTHPAHDDEEMRSIVARDQPAGAIARDRDTDRAALQHPIFRDALLRSRVRLCSYADL